MTRVPFALIAALLLAGSVSLAATTGPSPAPDDPAVETALDRGTAETRTALRGAVAAAARAAAREPVLGAANTTAGRAVNGSSPFEDALRIRVYRRASERLGRIDRRVDDVRVTASLPEAGARAAIESVGLRAVDDTAVRVRIENATLTARRDGHVLTRERFSPRLTVVTPVLSLHDRVETFERRLDAGFARPGFSRRFTAAVYAIAWTRGYAQHYRLAGLEIENVIANRHLSVAANEALLHLQRSTVGHSDPDGRRALLRAAGKTLLRDATAATDRRSPVLDALERRTKPAPDAIDGFEADGGHRRANRSVTVGTAAAEGFVDYVREDLNGTIRESYSVRTRLATAVSGTPDPDPTAPPSPGPGWEPIGGGVDTDTTVTEADGAPTPERRADWHTLASFDRAVAVTATRTRRWKRGNQTRTTRTSDTDVARVGLAVRGSRATPGPGRPIETIYRRGAGRLDGPNLADVADRAVETLVEERGGPDLLAERAADGRPVGGSRRLTGERPDGLRELIYRSLTDLRDRVRTVSVSVSRQSLATYATNPQTRLAGRLRERRDRLIDAPATYGSVAEAAEHAARAAYLDATIDRLERAAAGRAERAETLDERLSDLGAAGLETLKRRADARRTPFDDPAGPALRGPGGPISVRVDAAPSYLTLARIDRERVPAVDGPTHPLAARNRNHMALPYAGIAKGLTSLLPGNTERTSLGTAARTLRAAEATADERPDATVDRSRLRREVSHAARHVTRRLRRTAEEVGVGGNGSAVEAALRRWPTTTARALALSNGSAVPAIVDATASRAGLSPTERDWLELRLNDTRRDALRDRKARPRAKPTNRTRNRVRTVRDRARSAGEALVAERINETVDAVVADGINRTVRRAQKRLVNDTFDELPVGMPVAPVPGYWVATVNLWTVRVEGEYARFSVRTDHGPPGRPTAYVRDGSTVWFDADGDGDDERIGRATRLDVSATAYVAVGVPPGPRGVGDRNGARDETSPGWEDGG